jgi:hypothetical protein
MNKLLFMSGLIVLFLTLVSCSGDNSISPTPTPTPTPIPTPTTNPFAGNWNISFTESTGPWKDGEFTIESDGKLSGYLPDGLGTQKLAGFVNSSGTLTGSISSAYLGVQTGSFTGILSGNSGSGEFTLQYSPDGTWSASRR